MKKSYKIKSLKELEGLTERLAKELKPKDRLFLYGTLGAGKTTFTKSLVKSLGGKTEDVTSPTFTIYHEYPLNKGEIKRLHHIDLYRIDFFQALSDINLEECFNDPKAISVIEWAEKLPEKIKTKGYDIFIDHLPNDERIITIKRHKGKVKSKDICYKS